MIWYFLLSLHFIIEIVGVTSHLIFLKVVVFQGLTDVYCRISLGIISLSMLTMLISLFASHFICLSIGTVFEDIECSHVPWKTTFLLIHRYAEMISLTSQLFFTVERFLLIVYSRIHRSWQFKIFFVASLIFQNVLSAVYMYSVVYLAEKYGMTWLLALQFIILVNFPFVYLAKKVSKSKYQARVTTYSLKRKHNLYNYYEIARSFVYSSGIYFGAQLIVFILVWLYVAELVFPNENHKLVFIWNTNLTLFPWLVMLINRSQRERLLKVWTNMFPTSKECSKFLGMNGKQLVTNHNQTDYFEQLRKAWE